MGTVLAEPIEQIESVQIASVPDLRSSLLGWYDRNSRDLPWRRTSDPYSIWVSEIMLQQTRVAAVLGRYESFLRNFPTVAALAHAEEADVLTQWSGLGYYRRARMMHIAAKMVVQDYRGIMPKTAAGLRELPGIGAYTSAAIASIAYGEPVAVVDGNVERVVQRLAGIGSELRSGQSRIARQTEHLAGLLLDRRRAGDFNQSMMELGATVCLPRNPMCLVCPVKKMCKTRGEHPTPVRAKMRSEDAAYALVIRTARSGRDRRKSREVLLHQRSADQTVMPGMWELPSLRSTDVAGSQVHMAVRHAIMQVNYYVRIRSLEEEEAEALIVPAETRKWVRLPELGALPLTGLTRKILIRSHLPELTPMIPAVDSAHTD